MGKFNFASTLTINTTYTGEQTESYILKSFTENKTVASVPSQNIIDNIKYQEKIGKLDGSNLVQVGENCTFNDSGSVTISQAILSPKPFFINLQLCYEDLETIYNSVNSGDLNEQELSSEFSTALTELMVSKMNENWEDAVWNATGGTGSTIYDQFTGISAQITTNVTTVSGSSAPTKSNIISHIDTLVGDLPSDVLEKENLTIYMNQKNALKYKQAIQALGIITPQGDTALTYNGWNIVTISKIKDSEMYAFETSNLYFGVGALDNFSDVSILDQKKTTGDNSVRLKLQGKGDVKLGWESEAAKIVFTA